MRIIQKMSTVFVLLCTLQPQMVKSQPKPISLFPTNPHYFLYKKKPTVLITSAEHYGAVINLDFDFVPYLDELQSKGLNLTRVFTGAYVEPPGAFNITENTLAPHSEVFICPWQRSTEEGYAGGGNKFDLTRWNDVYFTRLKEFMSAAKKRSIVVELAFFCPFYEDIQWKISPMNATNNINGVGNVLKDDVYTMDKHGGLLPIQEAMVRKIVTELKGFENIIYEICNEPYFGGVKMEWQHHIASLINETEKKLKVQHLISQNIANDSARIVDPHPGVSVFNFHYASPPIAVKQNYHLNKVIGNNETGFRGQQDSTYRKEGWEFILAGGALYNNLDYSFTANHETGDFVYPEKQPGGGTSTLRKQLGFLKSFIDSFDFDRMKPDATFIDGGLPGKTRAYVLSEPGKQYAAYLLHGTQVSLSLVLPPGMYAVEWMNPATGASVKKEKLNHSGGIANISSPEYNFDIALSVVRSKN
jgi:hypothetical protein